MTVRSDEFDAYARKSLRNAILLADRVSSGAILLDRHRPYWWRKVKPTQIDLKSDSQCILGQIYGSYSAGVHALGGVWTGFYFSGRAQILAAECLWKAEIRRRQSMAWQSERIAA